MAIWVKIKQLISILFCGYRQRMEIHYCQPLLPIREKCKPKPILARGTGAPASKKPRMFEDENNFPALLDKICSQNEEACAVQQIITLMSCCACIESHRPRN